MIVGTLTLIVQTLFFSHILKYLGFHGTLLAEPVALMLGLVIAIVHPGLASIAVLDGKLLRILALEKQEVKALEAAKAAAAEAA